LIVVVEIRISMPKNYQHVSEVQEERREFIQDERVKDRQGTSLSIGDSTHAARYSQDVVEICLFHKVRVLFYSVAADVDVEHHVGGREADSQALECSNVVHEAVVWNEEIRKVSSCRVLASEENSCEGEDEVDEGVEDRHESDEEVGSLLGVPGRVKVN